MSTFRRPYIPLEGEERDRPATVATPAKGMFLLTFLAIATLFIINLAVLLSYGARIGTLETQRAALESSVTTLTARVTALEGCACNDTVECRQDTAVALLLDFVNSACDSIDFGNYTGPCPIVLADIIPPAACPGAACSTTLYEDIVATGDACSCDAQCAAVNDTCVDDLCTSPVV